MYYGDIFSALEQINTSKLSLIESNNITEIDILNKRINLIRIFLKINTLSSGFFLIIQSIFNKYAQDMHLNAVNFKEHYDNYVFGLTPNIILLKPIDDVILEEFSKKNKENTDNYYNHYCVDDKEKALDVLDIQKRNLKDYYNLIKYSKERFFNYVWFGTIFWIIIASLIYGIDKYYLDMIIQILIPSLSLIIMILSSMFKFKRSSDIIYNGINNLDILINNHKLQNKNITENDLRKIQDFIFNIRINGPMIPFFIQNSFIRHKWKQESIAKKNKIKINNEKLNLENAKDKENEIKSSKTKNNKNNGVNINKNKNEINKVNLVKKSTNKKNNKSKNNLSRNDNNIKNIKTIKKEN